MRTSLTLLFCLTALPACTDDPAPQEPSPDTDDSKDTDKPDETDGADVSLEGLSFVLQSAEGFVPVPDIAITLAFDKNSFSLYAGCNNIGGSYTLTDGALSATDLSATEIACSSELSAQESFLTDFFLETLDADYAEEILTLTGEDATLVFGPEEEEDPLELTGQMWTIDTFLDGQSASTLNLTEPPTVTFGEDGSVSVFSGCNNGMGSYTATADTLTFDVIGYTKVACADETIAAAENRMLTIFNQGSRSYEIAGSRLTILDGDLGVSATAN